MSVWVAALYRFAPFDDPAALRPGLLAACEEHGIRGTVLLAREGINGTVAGAREALEAVIAHIRALPGCAELDVKWSECEAMPFQRMKVRLKKEIVTLGMPEVDPARDVGIYVEPEDWNALISDPDTILIDTRNDYEVAIGRFQGAVDPGTRSFGAFPDWFRAHRARFGDKPRIAMYCTGGIRCEKSTAFLRAEGVEEVFHLKGGILNYLERIDKADSLWTGECFVFDERVSVGHGVQPGTHGMCRACGWPMEAEAASCPSCGGSG